MAGTRASRSNASSLNNNQNNTSSNQIVPPSNQITPQLPESDEPAPPPLDANEAIEIRRLIGSRLELLTESSKYNLWYASLHDYMRQYKLERHIVERIDPVTGDEDSKILCMSATSIVRSAISSSLLETLQIKYGTDPLGNAFALISDAKKAVTQVDIFSGPEMFFTMVNSDRQNFPDTNTYVRHMLEIRDKLANTAEDFKFTDRLFAWILVHGYRKTKRHVADDMENDITRGAKTPQEIIRQLQHIGDRERVLMSTAAVRSNDPNRRGAGSRSQQSRYAPWPTCALCGGRKHPPKAHRCKGCNCFHSRTNSCAPKCGKNCGTEFHYLLCKSKSKFICPADREAFQMEYAATLAKSSNSNPATNPPAASNDVFNSSGQVETYGYGPGKAATEQSHMALEFHPRGSTPPDLTLVRVSEFSHVTLQIPREFAASAIFGRLHDQWLLDTGASRTICNSLPLFGDDFRSLENGIELATTAGTTPIGKGIGTVSVLARKPDGSPCRIFLREAIYDPDALANIFSVGAVRQWGLHFEGLSNRLINENQQGIAEFEWHRNVPFFGTSPRTSPILSSYD